MKDITLNDLLAITEAKHLLLRVRMTPRLVAIVEVDTTDSAQLSDIVEVYGTMLVKSIDIAGIQVIRLLVELKR